MKTSEKELLKAVNSMWNERSGDLIAQADEIATAVRDSMEARGKAGEVGKAAINGAVGEILKQHDKKHGGFGNAPKFPNEPFLFLLLETARRSGHNLAMAKGAFFTFY